MSAEIIDLKKPEDALLVVRCDCGCTSMYVRSDRRLECVACGDEYVDDVTGVDYDRIKRLDDLGEDDAVSRSVPATADLTLARFKSKMVPGEVAAAVLFMADGVTRVFTTGWEGNDEARAWFQKRVDDLMALLR